MTEPQPPHEGEKKPLTLSLGGVFEDPISLQTMEHAVIIPCGHSFSEATIKDWLSKHHSCPVCNARAESSSILPNYQLREAIVRYTTFRARLAKAQEEGTVTQIAFNDEVEEVSPEDEDETPVEEENEPQATPALPSLIEAEEGEEEEPGKLIVCVLKARNLKNTDTFGLSDPYCVVEFQGKKAKTKVIHNNLHPKWNETFVFTVKTSIPSDQLKISIWDKDRITRDDFLGLVYIPFAEISSHEKIRKFYPLQRRKASQPVSGEIKLSLQYLPPGGAIVHSLTPPQSSPKNKKTSPRTTSPRSGVVRSSSIAGSVHSTPPAVVIPVRAATSSELVAMEPTASSEPVFPQHISSRPPLRPPPPTPQPALPELQPQPAEPVTPSAPRNSTVSTPPRKASTSSESESSDEERRPQQPTRHLPIGRPSPVGAGQGSAARDERVAVDRIALKKLTDMGFERQVCEYLLMAANNNVDEVLRMLLEQ